MEDLNFDKSLESYAKPTPYSMNWPAHTTRNPAAEKISKLSLPAHLRKKLIILVVALIALAVKLGLRKRNVALTGQPFMKQMNGDEISNLIPMGNSRTTTYLPVPTQQHQWVDQQALDLRLMEQQRLFEMMFCNAMRAKQTARVAPMPRAQILEVPVEPN